MGQCASSAGLGHSSSGTIPVISSLAMRLSDAPNSAQFRRCVLIIQPNHCVPAADQEHKKMKEHATVVVSVHDVTKSCLEALSMTTSQYTRFMNELIESDANLRTQLLHIQALAASASTQTGPTLPQIAVATHQGTVRVRGGSHVLALTPCLWSSKSISSYSPAVLVEHAAMQFPAPHCSKECQAFRDSTSEPSLATGEADEVVADACFRLQSPSVVPVSNGLTFEMATRLKLLFAAEDASASLITICSCDGSKVMYRNACSLAYAGCLSGSSPAGSNYLKQLLSLQPPELFDDVLETVMEGGPWTQVLQVPQTLAVQRSAGPSSPPSQNIHAPAAPNAFASQSPVLPHRPTSGAAPTSRSTPGSASIAGLPAWGSFKAAPMRSKTQQDSGRLAPMAAAVAVGGDQRTPKAGQQHVHWCPPPRFSQTKDLNSQPSIASSTSSKGLAADGALSRIRRPPKRTNSSWLEQAMQSVTSVSAEPGSGTHESSSHNPSACGSPMRSNSYRDPGLPTGVKAAAAASSTQSRLRSLFGGAAKASAPAPDRVSPSARSLNPSLRLSLEDVSPVLIEAEEDESPAAEDEGPCWHEVTITPFADPETGNTVLLIAQSDVTLRSRMEQRLMQLTEAQLCMLENMFPRHILERIACVATGDCGTPALLGKPNMVALTKELSQAATHHDCVTIMFTDIVGFTTMSDEVQPEQVMAFLNELFSKFDALVTRHKVSKVETAGDCYIVCAGLLEEDDEGFHTLAVGEKAVSCSHAARRVVDFAVEMMHVAQTCKMPNGQPVQQRVGIHSGPVASGLIGQLLPKFALFGDTMNTASRMESTSIPGRIQVSEATHNLLQDSSGCWECTGGVEVKGKGVMNTYLLASGAVMEKYQSASHLSSTDIHESLFESVFSSPEDATQMPTAMDSLLVTSCLLQTLETMFENPRSKGLRPSKPTVGKPRKNSNDASANVRILEQRLGSTGTFAHLLNSTSSSRSRHPTSASILAHRPPTSRLYSASISVNNGASASGGHVSASNTKNVQASDNASAGDLNNAELSPKASARHGVQQVPLGKLLALNSVSEVHRQKARLRSA